VTSAPRPSTASDASAVDDHFITVPENSEERRAFLQTRVALFGKMLAIISSLFLVASASSYFLLAPEPSILTRLALDRYDLAAIGLFVILWAIARRGRLPLRALRLLEAGVAIFTCAGYAIMVSGSSNELNIMVPAIAALAVLMARAVIIPTTPRRTFVVSLLGCIPSIVVAYILAARLGAHTSIPRPLGPSVYVACWMGMTVALSTLASRVVYGLEQKVRAARKLGQYTLVERIGEGGMGVVYRADHAMLRRPTAIKVLPPDKMGRRTWAASSARSSSPASSRIRTPSASTTTVAPPTGYSGW
jgi:serine/threonine-protein kinase